jgi:transcriptional regulator with XRE-family HTH domain
MQALTRLKERREELNLTQEQFADQVGVEAMTVSRWERGESLPRRKIWPKLREITGLEIAEIIAPALRAGQREPDESLN